MKLSACYLFTILQALLLLSSSSTMAAVRPSITSLSPTAASTGSTIMISGTNFGTTPGYVIFGSTQASILSWQQTTVTAKVPTGKGTVTVYIANSVGNSNTSSFTFGPVVKPTPSPSPTHTPTPTPSPSPTHSPTPSPSPSPTHSPTPTPSPSPTHTSTPTPSPSPSPSPTQSSPVSSTPSPISISSIDTNGTALQITLPLGSSNIFQLAETGVSVFGGYQLQTSNSAFLTTFTLSPQGQLTLSGKTPGRTSIKLVNPSTGSTRVIGVVVTNADGTMPGFPNYLAVGSVSQDDAGTIAFWQSFNTDLTNKRMDVRYIYLSGGPTTGWSTWGTRVATFTSNSIQLGMIPFFVFYNIGNGGDGYPTFIANLQSPTYMSEYFLNLQLAVQQAKASAGNSKVGFLLEPDFLGYMQQNNPGVLPSGITAAVSSAYSSGVLTQGVDPTFPNTVAGYVQAMNYIVRKYNSNTYIGWELSLWGNPTGAPNTGIIHATDGVGLAAGRAVIQQNATGLMTFALAAGIQTNSDFVSIDKYGYDGAGVSPTAATDPASSTWFWNADYWNNYLLFVSVIHQQSALPVVLWQLPVGHINNTTLTSPYTGSTFVPLTDQINYWEDSSPDFFLGNTLSLTTSTRSNSYFGINLSSDPQISQSTNSINWGSHMAAAAQAGVGAILFGAGVGQSTQGTPTPTPNPTAPTDGYFWISQIQRYFLSPLTGAPHIGN